MSTSFALTRRALLAGLGLAPLAGCVTTGEPLPRTVFRDVRVDTGEIVRRGLPNWADRVAAAATPALRRAFADRIDPKAAKAPVLVVAISAVTLEPWTGRDSRPTFGLADRPTDWMEGALILPGTAGRPGGRRPLIATADPAASGVWFAPDVDQRRLETLATVFARWARKEFAD